jgi:hypothetical protein
MSDGTGKKSSKKSKSSFSKNRGVVFAAVGAIAAVAVGIAALMFLIPTKLESAHELCVGKNPRFAEYSALDDDGKGLFLDGAGEGSLGLIISDLACAIELVGVPDSVISRIESTTALMGQQESTFDGITMRWTYHPSNGLDMSFEID